MVKGMRPSLWVGCGLFGKAALENPAIGLASAAVLPVGQIRGLGPKLTYVMEQAKQGFWRSGWASAPAQ